MVSLCSIGILAALVMIAACAGARGPAGTEGPTGATGTPGATGTTGLSGALTWSTITSATTAAPNHGYIVQGNSIVQITLPSTDALNIGDEIQLVSAGTSGFVVEAGAEESFRSPAGSSHGWVDQLTTLSPLYSNGEPQSVASDVTGQYLVAIENGGDIWTSTTWGGIWTNRTASTAAFGQFWYAVAADSTGQKLVAVAQPGDIWTSADGGGTWTNQTTGTSASSLNWSTVASGANGQNLVAAANPGDIWTSSDGGASWINRTAGTAASGEGWGSLSSDETGQYLAAVTNSSNVNPGGDIWTSTNFGVSWKNVTTGTSAANQAWRAIASDASGRHLVAAVAGGDIWTSDWTLPQPIVAAPATSLTLVYLGNGVFLLPPANGTWSFE